VKARKGGGIDVTVHSLGAKPAPASVVILEDGQGKELARAAVPSLAAPLDLQAQDRAGPLKGEWKPATASASHPGRGRRRSPSSTTPSVAKP
jgi:hypothetical protein